MNRSNSACCSIVAVWLLSILLQPTIALAERDCSAIQTDCKSPENGEPLSAECLALRQRCDPYFVMPHGLPLPGQGGKQVVPEVPKAIPQDIYATPADNYPYWGGAAFSRGFFPGRGIFPSHDFAPGSGFFPGNGFFPDSGFHPGHHPGANFGVFGGDVDSGFFFFRSQRPFNTPGHPLFFPGTQNPHNFKHPGQTPDHDQDHDHH